MFTWWANPVRRALLCGSAPQVSSEPVLTVMAISRTGFFPVRSQGQRLQIRKQWLTRRTLTEANYGFWVEDAWAIVVKLQGGAHAACEVDWRSHDRDCRK